MNRLHTDKQYLTAKFNESLKLKCSQCKKTFTKLKHQITFELKHNRGLYQFCGNKCASKAKSFSTTVKCDYCGEACIKARRQLLRAKHHFCGVGCHDLFRSTRQDSICKQCGKVTRKRTSYLVQYPNHFCSHKCAGTYNAAHTQTFMRTVSKLEQWLSEQLVKAYPNLTILFNDRVRIGYELDIYLPQYELAFEINGAPHYLPIWGNVNLVRIQKNDRLKKRICKLKKVELYVIDSSLQKPFTIRTSKPYLDQITKVIDEF